MPCFETSKYTILHKISDGAFSDVFLAKTLDSSQQYAIKKLKQNNLELFYNECIILSIINHSFICKFVEDIALLYKYAIVLEYIDGIELYSLLYDIGKFNFKDTIFISSCVLSALVYLHDKNIIYRDIKPENIILNRQGYAILVDFGLAKRMKNSKTSTICGTFEYMAPEIKQKKTYSLPADMYSFGLLLYELYKGTLPKDIKHDLSSIHPKALGVCLSNLLSQNTFHRKTAFALQWCYPFHNIDFESLEKLSLKPSYKNPKLISLLHPNTEYNIQESKQLSKT